MERKFNWKYVLYGVAAIFLVLIIYELVSGKDAESESASNPSTEVPLTSEKPKTKKQPAEIVKVTPSKSDISGPLHGYYEVVERSYKVVNGKMNVELRRVKDGFPQPWVAGMEVGYSDGYFEPGFYIELLDEDGDILTKDETSIVYDRSELQSLASLNPDETATISFNTGSSRPAGFRIGSSFTVHEPDLDEDEDEPDDDTPAAKGTLTTTSSAPISGSNSSSSRSSSASTASSDDDYDDDYDTEDDDDEYDDDYDDAYDEDDESTWQKVKKKSKRMYRNARQKFRNWLDK